MMTNQGVGSENKLAEKMEFIKIRSCKNHFFLKKYGIRGCDMSHKQAKKKTKNHEILLYISAAKTEKGQN